MTLLDIVLFLPLAGFLILTVVPKDKPGVSRMIALVLSVVVVPAVARPGRRNVA